MSRGGRNRNRRKRKAVSPTGSTRSRSSSRSSEARSRSRSKSPAPNTIPDFWQVPDGGQAKGDELLDKILDKLSCPACMPASQPGQWERGIQGPSCIRLVRCTWCLHSILGHLILREAAEQDLINPLRRASSIQEPNGDMARPTKRARLDSESSGGNVYVSWLESYAKASSIAPPEYDIYQVSGKVECLLRFKGLRATARNCITKAEAKETAARMLVHSNAHALPMHKEDRELPPLPPQLASRISAPGSSRILQSALGGLARRDREKERDRDLGRHYSPPKRGSSMRSTSRGRSSSPYYRRSRRDSRSRSRSRSVSRGRRTSRSYSRSSSRFSSRSRSRSRSYVERSPSVSREPARSPVNRSPSRSLSRTPSRSPSPRKPELPPSHPVEAPQKMAGPTPTVTVTQSSVPLHQLESVIKQGYKQDQISPEIHPLRQLHFICLTLNIAQPKVDAAQITGSDGTPLFIGRCAIPALGISAEGLPMPAHAHATADAARAVVNTILDMVPAAQP